MASQLKDPPVETSQKVPATKHAFFPHVAINAELWDKYMPYQLVLVTASEPNPNTGEISYTPTKWRFTLPIPPQELTLDMPIATNIQATMRGISAQHGGAPFKTVQLSGTTGIAPLKQRGAGLADRSIAQGALQGVFAGTIAAIGAASSTAQTILGRNINPPNVHKGLGDSVTDSDTILKTSTGYYQMRLMEQFIEAYVQMKSHGRSVLGSNSDIDAAGTGVNGSFRVSEDGRNLRMAFCMWKDEAVYLVEPLQFTKRRSASSPMEYMFSLQLRAYKRVQIGAGLLGRSPHEFSARKPNIIAAILNRVRLARQLLNESEDVLKAVVSDPTNVLDEALREASLFLADAAGARSTVTDLPKDVQDAFVQALAKNWSQIRSRYSALIDGETERQLTQEGRSGSEISQARSAYVGYNNAAQEAYRKKLQKLLGAASPEDLTLPAGMRKKIALEKLRVQKLGRADFEKTRNLIQGVAAEFAKKVGASHSVFAETYGFPAPTSTRTPTDSEMDVLFSLNELAMQMDHLAVSNQIDPSVPSSLEYVAGLAEGAGIAFKVPRSKMAVPFPYGTTLEQLALTYLGDANRWHEIATLNGLRAPYVDEEGFKLSLLTNGDRNTVMVADPSHLFPGQSVWLSSNGEKREKRHITSIRGLTPTQALITLDGDSDLERFTTGAQAVLEAFLPGTVNSQQIIYIPSDNEAPDDPRTKAVPGVNEYDSLLQVSGIDLLLTSDGDLAITPDGDCRIAYGLANIIQTVKIALSTAKGSLLQHPEYGLNVPVGVSTADVNAEEILKLAQEMFSSDPTFSGVRSAVVVKDGSALRITLDVGVAGTSQFIPISVVVKG